MATVYATKLAALAETEFNKFNGVQETVPPMSTRIKQYWTSVGLPFPGVAQPWAAIFVLFFVKSAGATPTEFSMIPKHSEFVFKAIQNHTSGIGVFHGRRIEDYAPKIGDILQNNRAGGKFDYDFAKANRSYKSHTAIVVEEGTDGFGRYIRTVGGNESNTVDDKIVRLKPNGLIKQPAADPTRYIATIETLK